MNNTLVKMVRDLRDAKDRKEVLENELKEVNALIRNLSEQQIPLYMDDNDIDKLSVENVGTVYLTTKIYASVKTQDRDVFHQWLRETGNGDLIKDIVHPATLNAFAKEQLSNGVELPKMLDARLYQTANLRRS